MAALCGEALLGGIRAAPFAKRFDGVWRPAPSRWTHSFGFPNTSRDNAALNTFVRTCRASL